LTAACERASAAALDRDSSTKQRNRAIQLISCFDYQLVKSTFGKLLDGDQPQQVQLAAIEALADYTEAEIATLIVQRWQHQSPSIRARALGILLSRDTWTEAYLSAVDAGDASIAGTDAQTQARLLNHPNQSIRQAAAKLLATSPRNAVIDEYLPILSQRGDADRGQTIFKRECSSCHRLGSEGFSVGPDLTSPSSRDPEAILANILDPNRYVAPASVQYLVVDKLGRNFTGMLASETASSITLTRGNGTTDTILRTNIDVFINTGKSLMPEGLEKNISQREMTDLLAYLCGMIDFNSATSSKSKDAGTAPGLVEP
jgi:putative heme-binding domain-containing protein